jgi:hypothetical protein
MEAIGFAMITRLGEGSFSPPVHFPTWPVRFSSYCCSRSDKDGNLDVVASDGFAFCCDGATSQIVTFIG